MWLTCVVIMKKEIKCPYCVKSYKSLQGLATHLGVCAYSTGLYVVHRGAGLLHYDDLNNKKVKDIMKQYPAIGARSSISSFKNTFKKRGISLNILPDKEYIYYVCPYCGKYAKKSGVLFKSWAGVGEHLYYCTKNKKEYYCDSYYGPLRIELFNTYSSPYLRTLYPKLTCSPKIVRTKLKNNPSEWSLEELIEKAKLFHEIENRFPTTTDFAADSFYPSVNVVYKFFNTWEKYIKASGLEYFDKSYGHKTLALDSVVYRSTLEAIFCNKFLFGYYDYEIEPKYPDSNWTYDWYLPKLDLYIEVNGGLRIKRTEEKSIVNKQINRPCLFVTKKDIIKYNNIQEILCEKL